MEATVKPSPQVTVSTTFPVRPPPTRQIPLRRRKSPTPSCPYLLDPNVNKCPYTEKNMECILYRDIHRPLDQSQLNLIISSKKITSSGKILYVIQFCWTRNWKWEWITIFEIPWYLQSTAAEWSFPAATLVMMYRVNGFTVLNVYLHGMS